MKKLLTALLLLFFVLGAGAQYERQRGGANLLLPDTTRGLRAAPAADAPLPGLTVVKSPVGAYDSYNGGLSVTRDTTGLVGGTPGFVNTTIFCRNVAASGLTSFEWCITSVLTNYAAAGENVVSYFQANKMSTGPTWAGVDEAVDISGKAGPLYGREIDIVTAGLAGESNLRTGLTIVVSDGRPYRGFPTDHVAEGSFGFRIIGEGAANPLATWKYGGMMQAFTQAGLVLDSDSTRGLWVRGKYVVGLDFGDAKIDTAIRLQAGQRITFSQYDQYGVSQDPVSQDIVFDNAGTALMRLTPGGHLYISGQLHQAPTPTPAKTGKRTKASVAAWTSAPRARARKAGKL